MRYILKRFFLLILNLALLSIFTFVVIEHMPGGVAEQLLQSLRSEMAQTGFNVVDEEDLRRDIELQLGLDRHWSLRYFDWVFALVTGDLGSSRVYRIPVKTLLSEKLSVSIGFGLSAVVWGAMFGLLVGFYRAYWQQRAFDKILFLMSLTLLAVPTLVLAIALRALRMPFQWSMLQTDANLVEWFKQMFFPGLCFASAHFVYTHLLFRNQLVDERRKVYFQTALAKGLSSHSALWRHALRAAIIPVISQFGSYLSLFVSGAIIIEQVFNLDGVGLLTYRSILNQDHAVVLSIVLIISLLYMVGRFFADVTIGLLHPQIRFGQRR